MALDALAERVRTFAGLDAPDWVLEVRVRERAEALGLDEDAYVAHALDDAEELAALAERLRVGETRFFRHRAQLEALARLLPDRARAAAAERRPLLLWSAGCASGEEAWTLAMLTAEAAPTSDFQLWATDLSDTALAVARVGRYAHARVAEVPEALLPRYFRLIGDEAVINDRLRGRVRFAQHNLLGGSWPRDLDLILCRNVLIYFDEQRRAQVIARLAQALRPGGLLLVGYSESLRAVPLLEALGDGIGRREKARAVPVSAPPARMRPTAVAASPALLHPTPVTIAAPPVMRLNGEYHEAERLRAELRPLVGAPRAILDLDGASYLGDEAARVLARAAEATPGLELRARRPAIRRWLERHGLRSRA